VRTKRLGWLVLVGAASVLPAQTDSARHALRTAGAMRVAIVDDNGAVLQGAVVDLPILGVRFAVPAGGRLLINDVRPGAYLMQVRRIGYGPQTRLVKVGRDTADIVFALDRVPTELDTVNVTANESEFARRLRLGHGRFFTAADIAKTNSTTLRQFLVTVPGTHLRAMTPGYAVQQPGAAGTSCPSGVLVYLDGVPVNGLEDTDPSRSVKAIAPVSIPRPAPPAPAGQSPSSRGTARGTTTAQSLSTSAATAIPDPLRATGALPPFDIDALALSKVAAMEVYPDEGSAASTSKCGRVYLWSKPT